MTETAANATEYLFAALKKELRTLQLSLIAAEESPQSRFMTAPPPMAAATRQPAGTDQIAKTLATLQAPYSVNPAAGMNAEPPLILKPQIRLTVNYRLHTSVMG